MKNLRLVAISIFSIFGIQNSFAQHQSWEIKTFIQGRSVMYDMGNDGSINSKYRGDAQESEMTIVGFGIKKRFNNKFWVGLEYGKTSLNYQLKLDRDFGDLDNIMGFSQPTLSGDYENIDKINYTNEYSKWGVNVDYQFFGIPEGKLQMTFGAGLEQHRLNDSQFQEYYGDFSNGFGAFDLFTSVFTGTNSNTYESNHRASFSQKTEALNYYNNRVSNNVNFLNLRYGISFLLFKYLALSAESTITLPLNSYHKDLMKMKPNVGVTLSAGVRF